MNPEPTLTAPSGPFAQWVQWHQEQCRGGRTLITAVNHRSGVALHLAPADVDAARRPGPTDRPNANALRDLGFLAGADCPPPQPPPRPPGAGIVWTSADRTVRRLHHAGLHRLLTKRWLIAQAVFGVAGAAAFAHRLSNRPVQLHAAPGQIPAIILLGLFAVTVHELGHALVTVHHGRHVRLVGLRLHLGSPTFYVDSLDALLLTRRQRLAQAAAGPCAEWLVNAAAALVLLAVPADSAAGTLLQRFVIVNAIGIAINLLPFVGLDGSLLLSDLMREPDLAVRARNAVRTARSLPARDWWMLGYAGANATIAAFLLVSAGFFWWQLFGGLVQHLCSFGPGGVALVVVGAIAMSGQLTRLATQFSLTATARRAMRRHIARIRFRTERRWRTRAIHAFLDLPELAGLDAAILGVIAGRLQRLPAGTTIESGTGGHIYLERDRTVIPAGDTTMVLDSRAVLLAGRVLAAVIPPDRWGRPSHVDTAVPSALRHRVRCDRGRQSPQRRLVPGPRCSARRPRVPSHQVNVATAHRTTTVGPQRGTADPDRVRNDRARTPPLWCRRAGSTWRGRSPRRR